RLQVEARHASDLHLFAGVRKLRAGRHAVFEGSYGFGYDMVSHGLLRASLRALDKQSSDPWRPVHPFNLEEPLRAGEIITVEFELLPSATLFRRGDSLRLDIQGR